MKRLNLMIVADHSFVVQAIRLALRQTAGFQVVGYFDGRGSVRNALQMLRPDVVLVDDMQEADNALARLREIAEEAPQAKSMLLTLQMEQEWLEEAFEAGANAVISKTVHPVSLGTLLREVSHGNIVHRFEGRPTPIEEDCPLTDRELEILRLVATGKTNGDVARKLWVTEQTVKFHLSNTYRKLGVSNRTEASRYATTHGFIPDEPKETTDTPKNGSGPAPAGDSIPLLIEERPADSNVFLHPALAADDVEPPEAASGA